MAYFLKKLTILHLKQMNKMPASKKITFSVVAFLIRKY